MAKETPDNDNIKSLVTDSCPAARKQELLTTGADGEGIIEQICGHGQIQVESMPQGSQPRTVHCSWYNVGINPQQCGEMKLHPGKENLRASLHTSTS